MAVNDLIDIDYYKNVKGINSPKYDTKLPLLIAAASTFIKGYTGRAFNDFLNADNVEYFNGTSTNSVLVSEFPVLSITSVSVSSDNGQTYTDLGPAEYFIDETTGVLQSVANRFVAPCGTNFSKSLRVTYKSGYGTLVGAAYEDATPTDIKLATVELVSHYLHEDYTPRKTTKGSTQENVLVGAIPTLPVHIKRILDLYREL